MKIGFFTDSYFPEIDGVTYTIKSWRERLEDRGHEVYVIYPDGDYEPGEREIPVKSVPNPFYSGYRVPTWIRTSKLPELDVVHCHSPATLGILGKYYSWRKGVPSVYTHHTPLEDYFVQAVKSETLADLLGKIYLPMENFFLKRFDTVTASTEKLDRKVDHVQLPVGLDLEFFRPTNEKMFDETVIGYSGRLSNEKNIGEILRLAERMEDTKFVIVGEGPQRERLEGKAPENVEFRDFLPREKLPEFYTSIDVFVTASTGDTLGLSTLEANACGTPVAAVDHFPFDETIKPENGERFTLGDPDEMERAVQKCIESERETREAVRKYSLTRSIDRIEELYGELV
jgi:glycosyltransferase involved in cell wall biosynthesis